METKSFNTVIDSDMEFIGTLKISGAKNLSIKGVVRGEVHSDGEIRVEEGGAIHGSIATRNLEVIGLVSTDDEVQVSGVLSMRTGGKLMASKISYGELEQERGARISGQMQPYEGAVQAETPVRKPSHIERARIAPAHETPPVVPGGVTLPFTVRSAAMHAAIKGESVETDGAEDSLRSLEVSVG